MRCLGVALGLALAIALPACRHTPMRERKIAQRELRQIKPAPAPATEPKPSPGPPPAPSPAEPDPSDAAFDRRLDRLELQLDLLDTVIRRYPARPAPRRP